MVGLVYAVTIVTAQSDEDGPPPRYPTYDECMYWENDHEYCEHLLPPTYTPTATATHTPTDPATHTHTPTATAKKLSQNGKSPLATEPQECARKL